MDSVGVWRRMGGTDSDQNGHGLNDLSEVHLAQAAMHNQDK